MTTFYSPQGNPEVWEEKPEGYFTPEEWQTAHPEPEWNPGPGYEKRDGGWWQVRLTKKEFLLLCGLENIVALSLARKENAWAETVYTLLMAAEYINVSDPDTARLVQIMASPEGGGVLSPQEAQRILTGVAYEA